MSYLSLELCGFRVGIGTTIKPPESALGSSAKNKRHRGQLQLSFGKTV